MTISLASDTNGSIRVPAAFCGLYGLKPTFGRLPRTGTFPFCDSLDHLGHFTRSADDLAYRGLAGIDLKPGDHLEFRALRPVACAVSACPDLDIPGWRAGSLTVSVSEPSGAGPDDGGAR